MRLENLVALVTGGSRGIGRAICVKLASLGVVVGVNYVSNPAAAEETLQQIKAAGGKGFTVRFDVADAEAVQENIKEIVAAHGQIDILVNNAGITRDGLILRMSEDNFDEVINTNLKGAFLCMKLASRIMMKQRWGRIINMSSVAGVRGNPGQVNYSASKAGLIGITKSLAKELAGRSVTVNAVAPGMIETDMTGVLPDAVKDQLLQGIPMARAGKPEEIAAAVAFLPAKRPGISPARCFA